MADLPHACEPMRRAILEANLHLVYLDQFREYGLEYADGSALHDVNFCPFCGARLPTSVRDQWFERLWALGLEPEDSGIPESMRSDRWWREAGL